MAKLRHFIMRIVSLVKDFYLSSKLFRFFLRAALFIWLTSFLFSFAEGYISSKDRYPDFPQRETFAYALSNALEESSSFVILISIPIIFFVSLFMIIRSPTQLNNKGVIPQNFQEHSKRKRVRWASVIFLILIIAFILFAITSFRFPIG